MNESVKAFFSIGKIIAVIILILVILLAVLGKMVALDAWLIGGLAAAIILS